MIFVLEEDNESLTPNQLISGYRQKQKHPIDEEEIGYSDKVTLTKREKMRRELLAPCGKTSPRSM